MLCSLSLCCLEHPWGGKYYINKGKNRPSFVEEPTEPFCSPLTQNTHIWSFLPEVKNICVPLEPAIREVGRVGLGLAGQEGILGDVDSDVLWGHHNYRRPWEEESAGNEWLRQGQGTFSISFCKTLLGGRRGETHASCGYHQR